MNKFAEYLKACEGKTIAKAVPGEVRDMDAVRITFTDDTSLTFYVHDEEVSLCIGELDYKFDTKWSDERQLLYVYNKQGNMVFSIPGVVIPEDVIISDTDSVSRFIIDGYPDVLSDYGLL